MYNFTIELERENKTPLYEQIYRHISNEIRLRKVGENERMPSKKSLASHLNVSINTVETAYSILVQEGYLTARPRSGYFVRHIDMPIKNYNEICGGEDEKERYAADFRTNAVDIKSFPYSTWIKLSKEVMYSNPSLLEAGDGKGDFILRKNIAKYLSEFRGLICSPKQIVIGAGIEYLTSLLIKMLGDCIYAVENPGYGKTARIIGDRKINYISVDGRGMNVNELKKSDSDVAYITPSHQFPTGAVMDIDRRYELLEWAGNDKYVIEDDYNSEFHFSIKPVPSLQGLSKYDNVIYLNTFSRALAPSIRIGYMVLPYKLIERYDTMFSSYSTTVSRFEQHTLNEFISRGYLQRHLNRVKKIYRKRRDSLIEILKEYNIKISGEKAGVHFTAETALAEKLLNNDDGIKLYSMSDYYFKGNGGKDKLVIGYGGIGDSEIEILRKCIEKSV